MPARNGQPQNGSVGEFCRQFVERDRQQRALAFGPAKTRLDTCGRFCDGSPPRPLPGGLARDSSQSIGHESWTSELSPDTSFAKARRGMPFGDSFDISICRRSDRAR
jgi:hypothetical protein